MNNHRNISPNDYDLGKAYRRDFERQAEQDHLAEAARAQKSAYIVLAAKKAVATLFIRYAFPTHTPVRHASPRLRKV